MLGPNHESIERSNRRAKPDPTSEFGGNRKTRLQRDDSWSKHVVGLHKQFADGFSNTRDSRAFQRSLETSGCRQDSIRQFGDALEGVRKKLKQATSSMDSAAVRTRVIERKLRAVEELPATEALVLLGAVDLDEEAEEPEAILVGSAAN